MSEISKDGYYVGTSFGFCEPDLLKQRINIENVVGMETHTAIRDEAGLRRVITHYIVYNWGLQLEDKDEVYKAVEIMYELFYNRPFFQSRLDAGYSVCDGDKEIWMFVHREKEHSYGKWKPKLEQWVVETAIEITYREVMDVIKTYNKGRTDGE